MKHLIIALTLILIIAACTTQNNTSTNLEINYDEPITGRNTIDQNNDISSPVALENEEITMENTVIIETNKGKITIELDSKNAPISTQNFLSYVQDGFYDGTIFHRVIPGFMIQGGGFDQDMVQKPTKDPIKNEAENGIKNDKYTLAMARTAVVDSATSQFFINVANNDFLNHGTRDFGYAVFGKVIDGFDVVDSIATVKTGNVGPFGDVPLEPVIMEKVYVKS